MKTQSLRPWAAALGGLVVLATPVHAAPGCVTVAPQIMTSDHQGQVSLNPQWTGDQIADRTSVGLNLDGAYVIPEFAGSNLQISGGIPLNITTQAGASRAALGDMSLGINAQLLHLRPPLPWVPDITSFVKVKFPTSPSVLEIVPSTGQIESGGFVKLTLGALIAQTLGRWDVQLLTEVSRSLGRSFAEGGAEVFADPGYRVVEALALGFTPSGGPIRLGAQIKPSWTQGPHITRDSGSVQADDVWSLSAGGNVTWNITPEWAVVANYSQSDERVIGVTIQKLWI